MNQRNDQIQELILQLGKCDPPTFKAFLGFDACIDNIVRVIKENESIDDSPFYKNSRQFGEFLISREGKSCGLELRTQLTKIGGNMVITGNALGQLGVKVDCAGTFGLPDILPIFNTMSPNCQLVTVGETITTTALEFYDAKVMMFDLQPYKKLNWNELKDKLEINRIKELLNGKQLISFLNWSEIEQSSDIWNGILDEVMPTIPQPVNKPYFFTDFSDCSRKSKAEIQQMIKLLTRFKAFFKVIVSLNQNEAEIIARSFELKDEGLEVDFIKQLFNMGYTDVLVIHRTKDAIVFDGNNFASCNSFFCENPTILTGGGDNFNAGFCFGQLSVFNLFNSLLLGNAVSGYYVRTGISPDISSIIDFLNKIGSY